MIELLPRSRCAVSPHVFIDCVPIWTLVQNARGSSPLQSSLFSFLGGWTGKSSVAKMKWIKKDGWKDDQLPKRLMEVLKFRPPLNKHTFLYPIK